MKATAWVLVAVVAGSVLWLLVPVAAAWATHSGRLDPFLEGVGRFLAPVGRRLVPIGAWLVRHPVAGAILASVPWIGAAAVSVTKGLRTTGVVQALLGVAYSGLMLVNLRRARRQQQTEQPTR